jgi:HB1, ASXL, restriction endonuclease HTH domain
LAELKGSCNIQINIYKSIEKIMEKSWKEAIKRVLNESSTPLHYTEISEEILSRGYYETDGATPAATVNAQLASSIKHDGNKSPFIRVAKGIFTLKDNNIIDEPIKISSTTENNTINIADSEIESSDSIIQSFGMYWQRDLVVWRNDPKMYGKQQALAKPVDFGKQKGIYILYDHHTVVYVGRSIDRPLGKRLYEHTVDRLGSRWDRFSWFGLLDVTQQGDLRETALNTSLAGLVATLEALLIESLEPPQNRKRGDDFSAIEYIQDIDPEIKEREIQNTLRSIEQKMRGS